MKMAIDSAYDFLEESDDYSYAYFPWESETTMHVTRSDAQLFSYIINYYDYMGGAHGYYYNRGCNFDPTTGRKLKLTDLVTDMSKLHELVVAQIKDEWETDELYEEWEDTVAAEFDDLQTVTLGTTFLRIRCLATPLMFLSFFHVYLFNGFGKGRYALFLGVMRWAVFNIPMLFVLNYFIGIYGLVWSQTAADILTVTLSVVVYVFYEKKMQEG